MFLRSLDAARLNAQGGSALRTPLLNALGYLGPADSQLEILDGADRASLDAKMVHGHGMACATLAAGPDIDGMLLDTSDK